MESNAALALGVWICFCGLIARMIEYLLTLAFVSKNLRWSVLVPIVCNFVALYYSYVMKKKRDLVRTTEY